MNEAHYGIDGPKSTYTWNSVPGKKKPSAGLKMGSLQPMLL